MNQVFKVELSHSDMQNEACATVSLPATAYELRDTLDMLRLSDRAEESKWIRLITEESASGWDFLLLDGTLQVSDLPMLNALTEKLSQMDAEERYAFEGLFRMDSALQRENEPQDLSWEAEEEESEVIPVARLYDLASSTECCYVAKEVRTEADLGRFYVKNGFLPEYNSLPENVLAHLNYEQIGAEVRKNGAFLPYGGYVLRKSEVTEASKSFAPLETDYAVLLEVRQGEKSVMLKLPLVPPEVQASLENAGVTDGLETELCCVDCKVPALAQALAAAGNISHINHAAWILRNIPDERLCMYKAVLSGRGFTTLQDALALTERLEQYIFTASFASPRDVARSKLAALVRDIDAERFFRYVDLYSLGTSLLEDGKVSLTPYGGIERKDGALVQERSDNVPERPHTVPQGPDSVPERPEQAVAQVKREMSVQERLDQRLTECLLTRAAALGPLPTIADVYHLGLHAAMHEYLTNNHHFEEDEANRLLRFQDPLEVAVEATGIGNTILALELTAYLDQAEVEENFPLAHDDTSSVPEPREQQKPATEKKKAKTAKRSKTR